jgi:hypothetical protein
MRSLALSVMCLLAGCVIHPGPISETLSGQVVDAGTGEPIAGAHLNFIDSPKEGVTSSADGQFTLSGTRRWQTVVMGADLNSARTLVAEAPSYERVRLSAKLEGSTNLVVRMHKVAK